MSHDKNLIITKHFSVTLASCYQHKVIQAPSMWHIQILNLVKNPQKIEQVKSVQKGSAGSWSCILCFAQCVAWRHAEFISQLISFSRSPAWKSEIWCLPFPLSSLVWPRRRYVRVPGSFRHLPSQTGASAQTFPTVYRLCGFGLCNHIWKKVLSLTFCVCNRNCQPLHLSQFPLILNTASRQTHGHWSS